MAIKNMMKEPAIANDDTSIPKMPSKGDPINKKARSMRKDTRVTLADLILPDFALISMIIGIDPGMSIIANRTIKAARISIRLKRIFPNLEQR
jgi:hypothetical protein